MVHVEVSLAREADRKYRKNLTHSKFENRSRTTRFPIPQIMRLYLKIQRETAEKGRFARRYRYQPPREFLLTLPCHPAPRPKTTQSNRNPNSRLQNFPCGKGSYLRLDFKRNCSFPDTSGSRKIQKTAHAVQQQTMHDRMFCAVCSAVPMCAVVLWVVCVLCCICSKNTRK